MEKDRPKGKLRQLGAEIKKKWRKVADDDLTAASVAFDILMGKIQERSGDRQEAIEMWFKSKGLG